MLKENGFHVGLSNPSLFSHEEQEIVGLVHGDDFITLSDDQGQDYFENCLKRRYQYKQRGRLGPRSGDSRDCMVLNRYIRWPVGQDPEYEADPRHAQVISRELGLERGAKVTSPIVKRDLANDTLLTGTKTRQYRSLTMKGAYLAQDRYDIQHCTKELATEMKAPTEEGMLRLNRLARYLNGAPRLVQTFRRQSAPHERTTVEGYPNGRIDITVDVDSDWAGDKISRKSTLCVVAQHGVNVIKTQVNSMKGISLSSGDQRRVSRPRDTMYGI